MAKMVAFEVTMQIWQKIAVEVLMCDVWCHLL